MHKQTYGVWFGSLDNPKLQAHWITCDETMREEGMPKIESNGEEILICSTFEAAEKEAQKWREFAGVPYFHPKLFAVCSCCEKEFDTDDGGNYQPDGLAQCVPCNHLVFNLMERVENLKYDLCEKDIWCQWPDHERVAARRVPDHEVVAGPRTKE